MAKIPEPKNGLAAIIDNKIAEMRENPRQHLGASMLGHHCDRWLWLSFRWAVIERFNGRMLRLFRRGQNEEAGVIGDLRLAGLSITEEVDGRQIRVDFGSFISGSLDGIIESGVFESPKKPHVLEIKTHSLESFDDLEKQRVEKSKPMHFAQTQVYMHGTGVDRALYSAVCKNDDRYYFERVRYIKDVAEKLVDRGIRITMASRLPEPCVGASPDWYQCKFCAAHDFCHGSKLTQQVNCRTCCHSTALPQSVFVCSKWGTEIPAHAQLTGCNYHALHIDLVPWPLAGSVDEFTPVYEIAGKEIANGYGHYSSAELINGRELCADNNIQALRSELGAKIIARG